MFKSIRTAALVTALMAATSVTAIAATKNFGNSAPTASAERHIVINAKTKSINVNNGETVEFKLDGKSFTWHFATLQSETSFDLSKIAPAGFVNQKVKVYVGSHPLYRS